MDWFTVSISDSFFFNLTTETEKVCGKNKLYAHLSYINGNGIEMNKKDVSSIPKSGRMTECISKNVCR